MDRYFFYVPLLEMNLVIDSLREEIQSLRKEVDELRTFVKTNVSSQYYVIHYQLEYFEPIDIVKLLEDMQTHIPWEEVYVDIKQESDKTFENPTLGIYKYNIQMTLYAKLTRRTNIDTLDTYFQTKLGTVSIDYFTSLSAFYTQILEHKDRIHALYKNIGDKCVSVPILWNSVK